MDRLTSQIRIIIILFMSRQITHDISRMPTEVPSAQHGGGPRSLSSEALFGGAREVMIYHLGEVYRLSITRQGKLILTK